MALQLRHTDQMQASIARGDIISRAELEREYLPLKGDYDKVAGWLRSEGFKITRPEGTRLQVWTKGTLAQIQKSLQVHFTVVAGDDGLRYNSADTAPSLPESIATSVLAVNHLQPFHRKRKHTVPGNNAPPFTVGAIKKAYNGNNLGVTGAGETIGIIMDTAPADPDLVHFWADNGISNSMANITAIDVNNVGPSNWPQPDVEVTLDVEWSSGMAPGAKIRVYVAGSMNTQPLDKCIEAIINDLPSQPSLHQVSMSFGTPESQNSGGELATESGYFATLAISGVNVFVSSGDSGSSIPDGRGNYIFGPAYAASDPNVVAVGGTSLTVNPATGARTGETGWSGSGAAGGSGGGVSTHFAKPAWQTGTGVPAGANRFVPDVSFPADPNTGAYIYYKQAGAAVGGTSWAAPAWAGYCALINQARANAGKNAMGLLTPKLYPLNGTANFFDITAGNNGFAAGVGYDEVTGLGSPNMGTLLATLVASAQTPPVISSFTPNTSGVGATVTITGANLAGATAVTFGGVAASSFTVTSERQITATVPWGAGIGPITVSTPGGTAISSGNYTVTYPAATITSFSPASGPSYLEVDIQGTNLDSISTVKFNGVSAQFSTLSSTYIEAWVPAGATTGPVTLSNPSGGTVTSTGNFTVLTGSTGTWSTTAWTGDSTTGIPATDSNATGFLKDAIHFGSTTDATVNGRTVRGGLYVVYNIEPYSYLLVDQNPALANTTNNLTALGGSGSALLAASFYYGDDPEIYVLQNLTVGKKYRASFFSVAFDPSGRLVDFGAGNDHLTVDQDQFGQGNGIRADYTFTALGTDQSISLDAANSGLTWHSHAIALVQIDAPVMAAPTSTNITASSAVLGGTVTGDAGAAITERGVVFALTSVAGNPTIGGNGVTKVTTSGTTGVFTVVASGLTGLSGYSYRAYATNAAGTNYTTAATFNTPAAKPTVTSATKTNITTSGATLGGNVTSDGGATITERGVVYSTNGTPTIGGTGVSQVVASGTTGVFTVDVTGLSTGTSYVFRAYATNSQGTTYTGVTGFTTVAGAPVVVSPTFTNVTASTVTLGGNVTSAAGATITDRGVIYALTTANPNPTIGGTGVTKVTVTGTTGVFTTNLTGLTAKSGYSFKAYATNSLGTSYTSVATFATGASWASTGSLAAGRTTHTATLLPNGKVLVVGGGNNATAPSSLRSAELYDPATGTWTSAGNTAAVLGYNYHTATLLLNGQVLVAGSNGYADLYNPATGTWTATGNLTTSRSSHTATLLPDGTVLVVGGDKGGSLATAEIYDPSSGTWTRTRGNLNVARYSHTATYLSSGYVLITAGLGTGGTRLASAELYDVGSQTFYPTGSLPNPRDSHTATLLANGQVLVVAGYSATTNSAGTDAQLFDPSTGVWTPTGSLATARADHSATLLPSGKVLVAAGDNSAGELASTEIYDPATGAWTTSGTLTAARHGHTATMLPNGRVLVAAGQSGSGFLTRVEVIDPGVEAWMPTGSLATARDYHTETLLPSGQVLVAGGYNGTSALPSAEVLDPASGLWAATGSLANAREHHTATLLATGQVLVAGGDSGGSYPAATELYDPAIGAWATTGSLTTARHAHTMTRLPNGKILVAGGSNGATRLASAELYDPATGTWAATGSLTTAREYHTATLLPNGKVLVTGGYSGSSYLATAELYNPATQTWATAGTFSGGREYHTATLLPNGKVLIAGGYNGSSYLASASVYDPTAGTWTTTNSLTTGRREHAATLLPSGKVLVAGGYNGSSLAGVEFYDPATGAWTVTCSLVNARASLGATLLANGQVLAAAGYNGSSSLASAEFYDLGLGYSASWQPQIGQAFFNAAGQLVLYGAGFDGVSGGSGGNTQDSPSNFPLVQVRWLDNEQSSFLSWDPAAGAYATAVTSTGGVNTSRYG
ncbi:MAG TPA: kelch repeat-containing protein, partial [Gemmatimonadales bacterium]